MSRHPSRQPKSHEQIRKVSNFSLRDLRFALLPGESRCRQAAISQFGTELEKRRSRAGASPSCQGL